MFSLFLFICIVVPLLLLMFFLKVYGESQKGMLAPFGSRPAEAVQSSSHTPPGPLRCTGRSPPNPFGVRASLVSDGNVQVNPCSGLSPRVHPAGDKAAVSLRTPRRSVASGVCMLSLLVAYLTVSPYAEGWS